MFGQEHGFILSKNKHKPSFKESWNNGPTSYSNIPVSFLPYMFNFPFSQTSLKLVVVKHLNKKRQTNKRNKHILVATQKPEAILSPGNCGSNWRPWCAVVPLPLGRSPMVSRRIPRHLDAFHAGSNATDEGRQQWCQKPGECTKDYGFTKKSKKYGETKMGDWTKVH